MKAHGSSSDGGRRLRDDVRRGVLALCLCGVACAPTPGADETIQSNTENLYYTGFADGAISGQLAHWPLSPGHRGSGNGADINVCFETNNLGRPGTPSTSILDAVPGSPDELARVAFVDVVRRSVENSWGRAADINFYGWDRCPAVEPPGWVVLRIINSGVTGCCGGSASGLGYHGAGQPTYSTVDMANAARMPIEAIHEFGHVLGFEHEFERADWDFAQGNFPGTAPGTTCRTDADCTSNAINIGSVCTLQVDSGLRYCRQPSTQGQALGVNADFHSVMAATYVDNCTGSTWDGTGNASPTRSLSAWDVIGAQAIYGVKPGGSIVGYNNLCATMTGSRILGEPCLGVNNDTFDSSLSGSTLFSRAIGATATLLVGDLVVNLNECMVNPGTGSTPLLSSACSSAGNQRFTLEHVRIRAMGNLCVAATSRSTGAGLELRKCDDAKIATQCGGAAAVASDTLDIWQLPESSSARQQALKLNNFFCVAYPSATPGASLSFDVCRDQANEQFVLTGNVIMAGGLCLTASDGVTSDVGTPLVLAPCTQGAVYQRFYLTSQVFAESFPVDTVDSLAFSPLETASSSDFTLPAQLWDYYWK